MATTSAVEIFCINLRREVAVAVARQTPRAVPTRVATPDVALVAEKPTSMPMSCMRFMLAMECQQPHERLGPPA